MNALTQDESQFMFDQHFQHTPDDLAYWNTATAGLSSTFGVTATGDQVPCSCGPHSLRSMRLFYLWAKPERMLEIGFNVGHSASVWIALGVAQLTSVDIRNSPEVLASAEHLRLTGGFQFFIADSGHLSDVLPPSITFDSAFVDGDHSLEGILRDIATCRKFGVKKYLFDDAMIHHRETIEAIKRTGLSIVFLSGNQMACEDLTAGTIAKAPIAYTSTYSETAKYRHLLPELKGVGIDVGCGNDPVNEDVIGIDLPDDEYQVYTAGVARSKAKMRCHADAIPIKNGTLDFVYSSHLLEDFRDWYPVLKEWWRVLKPGGLLVILIPDKDLFAAAIARGQPPNMAHQHEGRPGELTDAVAKIGPCEILRDSHTACDDFDYSILFVARKSA